LIAGLGAEALAAAALDGAVLDGATRRHEALRSRDLHLAAAQTRRRTDAAVPERSQEAVRVGYGLAMSAKAVCSAVFVCGREPTEFVEQDLKTDPAFDWWDDVVLDVDRAARRVTLSRPGEAGRTAVYNGDQGCTILPDGVSRVFFQPIALPRGGPDVRTLPWPDGDRVPAGQLPNGVDPEALRDALDLAFENDPGAPQNTRALVVIHRGQLIAERYAPGFDRSSKLVGWSMGKSLVAAMVGVLVERGRLALDDPAPVAAWRQASDPRGGITLRHLLQMSSGLDFRRDSPRVKTRENDHFYIYYGAIDVAAHSIGRPLAEPAGRRWAYRNGDPLTLGRVVRESVEADGNNHLTWPQTELFNRIGARDFVLEPDAWGNFILTGFDYGTARDWGRFGMLHLQNGIWNGERILPEGWVDFVRTPAPAHPDQGYGGLFWLNRGGVLPSVPRDAYMAAGHLGQRTLVVPSAELVIVRLGHSPDSGAFNPWFDELVARLVGAVGGARSTAAEP
jgi:CubicO group peptidase (beta-lactamase class C family)